MPERETHRRLETEDSQAKYESTQNKFSWEMFSGDAKQIGGLMAERV